MDPLFGFSAIGATALAVAAPRIRQRIELSRAKHRSLAGHARLSSWLARRLPYYAYEDDRVFRADGAPDDIEAQRRAGFSHLAGIFQSRFARTRALTDSAAEGLSDLQFTSRYRVPFPFSAYVRKRLSAGSFVARADGVTMTDLDGNRFYDLTGSYGVNLFGVDFYKDCMARGSALGAELGPLLGAYHASVADNVRRLKEISGLDEVSFHMSGTEAVMQAVRLARYHTRRRKLVRLCGAYHGWWGDVQPGVGNPVPAADSFTLRDMDERSLQVLDRRGDIACVLVNPLQAMHPNDSAPGDSALVDSSRRAGFDRKAYTQWLRQLREVCTRRGIVLVLDEVFVGFRIARGGAQEYFDLRADLVTYGKTVGGGFPVGVLCGRAALMRRFRDDRPADICFARGTFNSHPYVMGAMRCFLESLDQPEIARHYEDLDERWNSRAARLNTRLAAGGYPVRIANLSTIWVVTYLVPSRYNWMLQFYLRAHGLALSWVGTGRLIFNLACTDEDFEAIADRFEAACREMSAHGWWWNDGSITNRSIRRMLLRDLVSTFWRPSRAG